MKHAWLIKGYNGQDSWIEGVALTDEERDTALKELRDENSSTNAGVTFAYEEVRLF